MKRTVHTTSNAQWCKECQLLLPPMMSLMDHEVKVHGRGAKTTGGVAKSSSTGTGTREANPTKKNITLMDTQNLNNGFKKQENESSFKRRRVSKKSTAPRPARTGNKEQIPPSSPNFFCTTCGQDFTTIVERNNHEATHSDKVKVNDDDADVEEGKQLFCFDCGTHVEKKNYVKHLMLHDEEKRAMQELWLKGKSKTPSRKRKAPEPISIMDEKEDRKYLYLNPNDPRKNAPNAILQCPQCPNHLFFTTETYKNHCDNCVRFLASRRQATRKVIRK